MGWSRPHEEFRADHYRDHMKHEPRPLDQRTVVASLIGECESIAASGLLTEPAERSLRLLIAKTCVAFSMPSKAERESV
jgi:hypothetical protein